MPTAKRKNAVTRLPSMYIEVNYINNELDATVVIFINNFSQIYKSIIRPIVTYG